MKPITAIIFDMDGVLIHSSPAHEKAFRRVLEGYGVSELNYPEIAGMRTPEAFRLLLERRGLSLSPTELASATERKRTLAHEEIGRTRPIVADCRKILGKLRERCRLGLASSSSSRQMSQFLALSETAECFDATVHGEEVAWAKPAPDIFRLCAERMKKKESECLVIEDSRAGVGAALAGDFRVLVVGNLDTRELSSPLLVGKISRLEEIEDYL